MKTSIAVLALLGVVTFSSSDQAANATQLERYFPHHSWEKANPAEFVKNLNKEVEAEQKRKQGEHNQKNGQLSQAQSNYKKSKKDESMVQQDTDGEYFTAHEMAIQLKETMQNTFAEMGIDYKVKDQGQNDLVQVTADDFDNLDHYSAPKARANREETDELNRQRAAHITRIEQRLTDRINTLLTSTHRSDSDEGELEDVLLEIKPIKKL